MSKNDSDSNKGQFKNIFNFKFVNVVIICALILILLSSFIINYNRNKQNSNNIKGVSVTNAKFPYPIDLSHIKFVTRLKVFPINYKDYPVFETGDSKYKIDKILNLINSGSKIRVSTEEDLKAFQGKGPYPTTLKITNQDDSYFLIMPAYTVTQKKLTNGGFEIDKTPLKDRFILEFFKVENSDKCESYTIFSNEVENYLLNTTKELENDFPLALNAFIEDLNFISDKVGYMCESTKSSNDITYELLKTLDGGHSWNNVLKDSKIIQVKFCSEKIGFAIIKHVDDMFKLAASEDGGATWKELGQDMNISSFDVIDAKTIFVTTQSGYYVSKDGGKTFIRINDPSVDSVNGVGTNAISFISSKEGYLIVGGQGFTGNQFKTLYYTKDGGKSWVVKADNTREDMDKNYKENHLPIGGYGGNIRFFKNGVGYIGLTRGGIWKTMDAGKTFKNIAYVEESVYKIDFINEKEGYAIINNGIVYTKDGGSSWSKVYSLE